MQMKKIVLPIAVAVVVLFSMAAVKFQTSATFTLPTCLQDQYGNQYQNLAVDNQHEIITGTMVDNQCGLGTWPMIGSYSVDAGGRVIMEISVANPTGGTTCVPIYTLRGPYPTAYWNYDTGFGKQQFAYAACSTRDALPPDPGVGGAHGPE